MGRRLFVFTCLSLLFAAQMGCSTSRCGERKSWFSSRSKSVPPCQLTGRNSGCFDAITGQPVPCPPDIPTGGQPYPYSAIPNVAPMPGEMHMPSPTDLIQPPAVPLPAPGDASLPFPTTPGVPVKSPQK